MALEARIQKASGAFSVLRAVGTLPQPCQNAPNETVSYGHSRTPGNPVRPRNVLVAGDRSGDLIRKRSAEAD